MLVRDGCVLNRQQNWGTPQVTVSLSFALLTCLSVLHYMNLCTCLWALTLEEGMQFTVPNASRSIGYVLIRSERCYRVCETMTINLWDVGVYVLVIGALYLKEQAWIGCCV